MLASKTLGDIGRENTVKKNIYRLAYSGGLYKERELWRKAIRIHAATGGGALGR